MTTRCDPCRPAARCCDPWRLVAARCDSLRLANKRLALECAKIVANGVFQDSRKNVQKMSWGSFLGVADKMSKKCQKNVLGSSWGPAPKKRPQRGAPKGARRFAPRPFGSVEGHENGFKRSKNGPEKVWGPFFDIFLTSCRSPAGPQDLFWIFCRRPPEISPRTFFGHFSANPE